MFRKCTFVLAVLISFTLYGDAKAERPSYSLFIRGDGSTKLADLRNEKYLPLGNFKTIEDYMNFIKTSKKFTKGLSTTVIEGPGMKNGEFKKKIKALKAAIAPEITTFVIPDIVINNPTQLPPPRSGGIRPKMTHVVIKAKIKQVFKYTEDQYNSVSYLIKYKGQEVIVLTSSFLNLPEYKKGEVINVKITKSTVSPGSRTYKSIKFTHTSQTP